MSDVTSTSRTSNGNAADHRMTTAPPVLSGRRRPEHSPLSGAIGPLDSGTLTALGPETSLFEPAVRTDVIDLRRFDGTASGTGGVTPPTGSLDLADPFPVGAAPVPDPVAAPPAPRSRRERRATDARSAPDATTGTGGSWTTATGGSTSGGHGPGAGATAGGLLSRRSALAAAGTAAVVGGGFAALVHDRLGAAQALEQSMTARPATPSGRAGTGAAKAAPAKGGATSTTPTGLLALPADLDLEHTLRRFTYGATPTLRAEVAKTGVASWLAAQLDPKTVADPGGDAVTRRFPRLDWSVAKTVAAIEYKDQWAVMMDLAAAHIGRAIWSKRQLFEVMVDFWSNHLNITNPSDGVWHSRHRYDADVIRRHALGRFEDMLVASAFHPAMLVYLDAYNSTGQEPNENYARELLELHTVGVDGGYTERDIKQAARLITGWTVDEGKVGYDPDRHWAGRVKVMGWSHPNPTRRGGKAAVTSLLKYLAHHPSTARYLARKLAVRFVTDTPSDDLVERLATVYLQQKTAIKPVLVALIASPEFAASEGQKARRPFESVVATLRATGARLGKDASGLTDLYWALDGLGHKPLAWPMPNGYPDVATKWQSPATALNRINAVNGIVQGWWPNKLLLPKLTEVFPDSPRSRSGAVDAVARRLFGRAATAKETQALDLLLAKAPNISRRFGRGSWEQQVTLSMAMVLLLNSPAHLER